MSSMVFPDGLQLMTVDDAEAEDICRKYCQNDDNCKLNCFGDDCPLGSVELQRLIAINKQRRKGFTHEEALIISAMIGSSF